MRSLRATCRRRCGEYGQPVPDELLPSEKINSRRQKTQKRENKDNSIKEVLNIYHNSARKFIESQKACRLLYLILNDLAK